jgi:tetratricopeptide (TPR) repeat protein
MTCHLENARVNFMMKKPLVRYSQKSVLIIEDFTEFARSLRGMMTSMGSKKIELIYNGEDAIQLCKQQKFDIILSDYNLGNGKDGQQVLEELHCFNLLKTNTMFIMVTAENTAEMVMGALEYQPDSYLTKPFNAHILKLRLDKGIYKKDIIAPIIKLMRKKKWLAAIEMVDQIIAEHPKFRMACLRHKFSCLKQLKKYDNALELTTDIINERPIPWAMLGVGEIYFAKKEIENSSKIFSDMITEFPMVLEGYDWLAKIQKLLGQPLEAQNTLLKAVKHSPKALKRQKTLGGLAEENNDFGTMTSAFRQAVKYGSNSAFASPDEFLKLTKSIGMQLKSESDIDRTRLVDEAESVFKKLDNRFKNNPNTQFRSAVAHADFGAITENDETTDKYLNVATKYYDKIDENIGAEESLEIATSLKNLGQEELAESILKEALEQNFDNPNFMSKVEQITSNKELITNGKKVNQLNNKAINLYSAREYLEAIDYFEKASDLAPNNINIQLNHIQALLKQYQTQDKDTQLLNNSQKVLSSITRLRTNDPRYSRYAELSRLTQLMLQST